MEESKRKKVIDILQMVLCIILSIFILIFGIYFVGKIWFNKNVDEITISNVYAHYNEEKSLEEYFISDENEKSYKISGQVYQKVLYLSGRKVYIVKDRVVDGVKIYDIYINIEEA